ncbi:MAG: J domain-containing protein [Actinobacteria bacterium]|nr:J domain-containing protein [Actinomycetota bacterium]
MTLDEAARILGVEVGASPERVQRAFRVAARSSHPDAGGADARFIELTAARDALLAAPPVVVIRTAPAARWSWPLFWTWTALLALAIFLSTYLAPLPFTIVEPLVRFPLLALGLVGYALTGRTPLLVVGLVALGATAVLGVLFATIGVLVGLLLLVAVVFGLVTLGQGVARRRF